MQVSLTRNADGQTYCRLIAFDVDVMVMFLGDEDEIAGFGLDRF